MWAHMRRVAVPAMQITHLLFLFCIAPLWFLVMQTSESDDTFPRMLSALVGLSGIVWASVLFVLAIRYGDKEQGPQKLFKLYRKLLESGTFLVASNLFLIVVAVTLAYQSAAYRQVEFTSSLRGTLLLSDKIDEQKIVGRLEANTAKKIRLRIGTRHLVFQADGVVVALAPQDIRPWWRDMGTPEVDIAVKDGKYEKTR